jgi:hypothetical protein
MAYVIKSFNMTQNSGQNENWLNPFQEVGHPQTVSFHALLPGQLLHLCVPSLAQRLAQWRRLSVLCDRELRL